MLPSEEKIYYYLANVRTVAFRPLNKLLSSVGVTADMISYLGVLLMIGFVFALPNHAVAAFWLLFGRMMADIMDGPLARHQKTDSDRGKFVDVLMDNLAFWLFIVATVRAGLLSGLYGILFLFLCELSVVLLIIRYNIKHKSEWYFYASAGSFPYNFVYAAYAIFGLYAFGGHNYLNGAAQIFSICLAVKSLADYWAIQKSYPKS
jgi:phosphatidylglycerophosphate synthase